MLKSSLAEGTATSALRHAFEGIRELGGPVIPFVVTVSTQGDEAWKRFTGGELQHMVAEARKHLHGMRQESKVCCLVYDASLTEDGKKSDAIVAEVSERGRRTALVYCLKYRAADDEGEGRDSLVVVGQVSMIGTAPSVFSQ